MRQILGLFTYTSFEQITIDATVVAGLKAAYTNINDIDLWVGGLAEDPINGAMVGATFRAILIDQFTKLRDGDNQWYENKPWSPSDLEWINNTTLSDVILRNTSTVRMQADAFIAVDRADLYNGNVSTIVARASYPTSTNVSNLTFSIISGALPGGLGIKDGYIVGSPFVTQGLDAYQFCIRANGTANSTAAQFDAGKFIPGGTITGTFLVGMTLTGSGIPTGTYIVSDNGDGSFAVNVTKNIASVSTAGYGFADRTFKMNINGANAPVFTTPAGNLPVGTHQQLYALDNTFVSYQIEAFDENTLLGNNLKYFIASGDGKLPPGLTLSNSGEISGYILPNPQTVVTVDSGTGAFDDAYFDDAGYDFATLPTDGFDSYQYDDVTWDYSSNVVPPSTLNQNYQFKVTVSDGISSAQRVFKIFVLGNDAFRADSTEKDGFAGGFTADSSFLRTPVWLSKTNLGTYRANNYLTVPVALYDNSNVIFRLETTNCEVYAVTKKLTQFDNIQSITLTGNLTLNSPVITGVEHAYAYTAGQTIEGAGIPSGSIVSSTSSDILLSNVVITSTNGTFTCDFATSQLYVGQKITVSGQFGVSSQIADYTPPSISSGGKTSSVYYITATNGFTSFTLSNTFNGIHVTTIAGTPTGVTFTANAYTLTLSTNATLNLTGSTMIYGGTSLTISNASKAPTPGQYFTFDNYIAGASSDIYLISSVADLGSGSYRLTLSTPLKIVPPDLSGFYIGTLSQLPNGTTFDVNTGEIYGKVPYQPAITQVYTFTVTAVRSNPSLTNSEYVISFKTFNIVILGLVTSQITWNSPSALGSIPAAYPSTLSVSASSNVPSTTVLYYLTGGSLPYGLSLSIDGEIVGTPTQYGLGADSGVYGLTTFHDTDSNGVRYVNQTFDNSSTTIDRKFTFQVTASDSYQYSALPKTFTINVTSPNSVPYSNITTQPFLAPAQRNAWRAFINNTAIFTPSSIYRANDPVFGVQTNLQMLVYAGIQTEAAAAYVGAMGLGFKRKRFKFSSVKTAVAIDPNSGNDVYEVVYVQMIDPSETSTLHPSASFKSKSLEPETITVDDSNSIWSTNLSDLTANAPFSTRPGYEITVDSTGYQVSNPNTDTYYNNTITNWQNHLSTVGLTERNYLPLWMRSIPSGSKAQLGYVLCVPICFCKPGTSAKILTNIKYSGFDFNTIDYTVDRFTISAVTGYTSDKYLVFRDDRITV